MNTTLCTGFKRYSLLYMIIYFGLNKNKRTLRVATKTLPVLRMLEIDGHLCNTQAL